MRTETSFLSSLQTFTIATRIQRANTQYRAFSVILRSRFCRVSPSGALNNELPLSPYLSFLSLFFSLPFSLPHPLENTQSFREGRIDERERTDPLMVLRFSRNARYARMRIV
jgi:hypothetical protein